MSSSDDGQRTHTSPILPASPYSSSAAPSPDASSISPPPAVSAASSPSSVSAVTSRSKHSDHTGAIVGGVIGGFALFLLIAIGTILLRRRLRARRTAPSAEFMDIARGATPGRTPTPGFVRVEGTTTPSGDRFLPLARQGSLADDGDDDRPPMFTPGAYTDPVFEKVRVAAAMREEYEGRSSLAHEEESVEEGHGANGDEKVGQYTWAM